MGTSACEQEQCQCHDVPNPRLAVLRLAMPRGPHRTGTVADAPDGTLHGSALVVCLCAEWCTACRAYRAVFDQVAADHPDLRFLWVDIEDSAALLDQIEVENFPTILIGEGASAALLRSHYASARSAAALDRRPSSGSVSGAAGPGNQWPVEQAAEPPLARRLAIAVAGTRVPLNRAGSRAPRRRDRRLLLSFFQWLASAC